MLTIQRASAGSGKTYALTKKYLWFLLTIVPTPGKGRRRLRRLPELYDAASHILAVTFTNKATNEMKARIVDKLASLASACAPGKDPMKADYMKDFCKDLDETPERVAEAAGVALRELLNAYGDFHVTTIDSFFQTVLRTFAYEIDLNDSYSLELDSNYVANVGMEGMLEEVNDGTPSAETEYWIREIMNRAAEQGSNWNLFQRSGGAASIYRRMLDVVQRMEKEDFKLVRNDLDRYFEANPNLREVYQYLCDTYEAPVRETHQTMQRVAREIQALFVREGRDITTDAERYLNGRVQKALKTLWHSQRSSTGENTAISWSRDPAESKPENVLGTSVRKELKGTPFAMELYLLVCDFYNALTVWKEKLTTGDTGLWMLYRHTFPYMGLLQCVRGHIKEFRETNNTLELGETNSMLRRIIGDDDAPFIYERLGSRINHFLIDEFQDTSRMQWDNLQPLLKESESRGHDNLIIGDAKQSIYRFRNADPSLITTKVPKAFPGHVAAGMSEAENTNWRSDLRIVRFNNYFFNALAECLDEDGQVPQQEEGVDWSMKSLYANTVQHSHHRDDEGYVEINLFTPPTPDAEEEAEPMRPVTDLIVTLLSRGYRQRDIAILVERHTDENEVVQALIEHNRRREPGTPAIDFLSEGSLTLGASEAVRIIIDTLEAICAAVPPQIRQGEERRKKGVADWEAIRCSFNFFALEHPEMEPAEQLEAFLNTSATTDVISDMLGEMHAVALPALVEAIAEKFVPKALRDAHAPYLAMLQDSVSDYCQGYSADIASFLDWWRLRGRYLTISSPEETDAVRIMTIHKSKGLEFPVVILPNADTSFETKTPSLEEFREWRWVKPAFSDLPDMPPYVPLRITEDLDGTPHAGELAEYKYLKRMDKLNTAYVAFTRAVHELYIFAPVSPGKDGGVQEKQRLGSTLYRLLTSMEDYDNGHGREMPDPDEIIIEDNEMKITYGLPRHPVQDTATVEPQAEPDDDPSVIKGYYVHSDHDLLKYSPEVNTRVYDDEDDDPRSFGNLMHTALADIHTEADIPRAVRRLRVQGLLPLSRVSEITDILTGSLRFATEKGYGWFDDSRWRMINERAVLSYRRGDLRPDRLLISPEGREAVVIDYKFGAYHSDNRYRNQVRRYIKALLDTGDFDSVTGYLWYVPLGIIETV